MENDFYVQFQAKMPNSVKNDIKVMHKMLRKRFFLYIKNPNRNMAGMSDGILRNDAKKSAVAVNNHIS